MKNSNLDERQEHCFIVLSLSAKSYKKRIEKLEQEPEEEK